MVTHRWQTLVVALPDDAVKEALERAGCELIHETDSALEALRCIGSRSIELVLADAVLPGLDGVELVRRIRALPLRVHPMAVLMRLPGMPIPGVDQLKALEAALVDKPVTGEALSGAIARLSGREKQLPEKKAARLEALLDELGVPEHLGRQCLSKAVALAWADQRTVYALRDKLYPQVARCFDRTSDQVERAIRHVIDTAWRTGEIERQHRIFGDTIDASRGRPTCGEMIAQLADILRWEE